MADKLIKKDGWAWLGVLTWNTHMGQAMTPEMWRWIRDFLPKVHIIMWQEVDNLGRLQNMLGPGWVTWPLTRTDNGRGTTYVSFKKKRFGPYIAHLKNIRYSSRHSRQVVALDAVDRQTKRPTFAGSLHLDPLGKGFKDANAVARRRHERQANAWAETVRDWQAAPRTEDEVTIVAGDGNELLSEIITGPLAGRTLTARFAEVGLRPAFARFGQAARGKVRLDDVWVAGKDVRVVRRMQFRPGPDVPGAQHLDHDLVFALLSIKKAS